MDYYYQSQEIIHKRNKLINSIKRNIKEHCNNINDLTFLNINNYSLYLHYELYINTILFRFIINILLDSVPGKKYRLRLILCKDGKREIIKKDLKNEIELSFYILHTKKNYEKILSYKNQLSKIVLNNIKFNKLFIQNDEGVLLVKKMELVKMFNLPDEIIDIILIKLF